MGPKALRTVGAVVVLAVVVGLLVGILIGRSGHDVVGSGTPAASPATAPPTETGSPTPTRTRPPSVTPSPFVGPVITPAGAELRRTGNPVKALGAGVGCTALEDPGFTATCGSTQMAGGRVVWVVEYKPLPGIAFAAYYAYVYAYVPAAGGWVQSLRASDPHASKWTGARVIAADLTGDGRPELVFGFHYQGSGSDLGYDVVTFPAGGSPGVAAHPDVLVQGSVRVSAGRIDQYSAQYPNNEPNCCPPYFLHDTIAYVGGVFRVTARSRSKPSAVPSSEL